MDIHQQAFQEIHSILQSWDGKRFYWIHLRSEPGAGCSTLLRNLESRRKSLPYPLFRVTLPLATVNPGAFLRWLVRETFPPASRLNAMGAEIPSVYRQWILAQAREILKNKTAPAGERFRRGRQLLRWRLQTHPIILVVDDFPRKLKSPQQRFWRQWFGLFSTSKVLLLTAGHGVPAVEEQRPDYVLTLPGITMKGAAEFLQQKYGVADLVARMMVNQLYLKSEGSLQKLHWLVRTFFPDIIENPEKPLSPGVFQRKIQSPQSEQQLLRAILEQLPLTQQQILGFFSRLDKPLPEKLVRQIIQRAGFTTEALTLLMREHFLETDALGRETYFYLKDSPLKEFLKVHISGDLLTPFQESVRGVATRKSLQVAPGFYRVLLDSGYLNGALEVAFNEARILILREEWEEAAEFLHFLRRNLEALPGERRLQVLRWLATFYQKNGLAENYFETLREYREMLGEKATQEYLHVSLEMADALLKMDAFGEARYLIREARATKIAQPAARLQSMLLAGDLERYLGHPEYAVHQYREALRFLPRVPEHDHFAFPLYQRFLSLVQDGVEDIVLDDIARSLIPFLARQPLQRFRLEIDLIRRLMEQGQYQSALTAAINLYRGVRFQLSPEMVLTLDQLLGELYGTAGKWHLAGYHLRRALTMVGFATSAVLADELLLALGVVFKETGAYHKALRFFERVHQQAGLRGDFPRFVQAKLHLAHVHILVHNPLKALDYIRSTLRMEETLRDATLILTAKLLAVSLDLQQENLDKAATYLEEARDWAWQTTDPMDALHLQYYEILYALKAHQLERAEEQLTVFQERSQGLAKFAILSTWLAGQLHRARKQWKPALTAFEQAMAAAQRCGMVHLAFQIGLDWLEAARNGGNARDFPEQVQKVNTSFQQLLQAVGDPILQKQLEESTEGDRWKQFRSLQSSIGEKRHVH